MMIPYYQDRSLTVYCGNAIEVLKKLPDGSVNCCVTSPPYWGLRDYGIPPTIWDGDPGCSHEWEESPVPSGSGNGMSFRRDKKAWFKRNGRQPGFCVRCGAWCGNLGLEPTPELYVHHIVTIFREVWRVLRDDGTLWLNLGDSYASTKGSISGDYDRRQKGTGHRAFCKAQPNRFPCHGMKSKELVGIPWRVAFALRAGGWLLRRDIIWHKPNPMPESVKDRPTTAHEYIFLMSKKAQYYYDAESIKEPASPNTHARYARGRSDRHKFVDGGPGNQTIAKTFSHMVKKPSGWDANPGGHKNLSGRYPGVNPKAAQSAPLSKQNPSFATSVKDVVESRNKRSVWTVPTAPYKGPHYATFPPDLIVPCILAGCPQEGIVLDPFAGTGVTGMVAERLGRKSILIELNRDNMKLIMQRNRQTNFEIVSKDPAPANIPNRSSIPSDEGQTQYIVAGAGPK